MRPPERLYILGTGVLAEEFFALATDMDVKVEGFVENLEPAKDGDTLCGRPILWFDKLPLGAPCVCALSTTRRSRFIDDVEERADFVNLVHPSSTILPGTELGPGTVVSTGVLIASNTRVGRHVFLNRGARLGHHTEVGDFVTIQPGANIAGLVRLGDRAYIGMGAIVVERSTIGRATTVAAGAVVIEDVPDHVLVAGVPAVIKKREIDAR